MGNHRKDFLLISAILVLAVFGCRPNDAYFAKPDSLAGPIYQQLESMGNFTYYLQCLYLTPYGDIFAKSGSWPVVLPDDQAVHKYILYNYY